ncbi:hypothetical protein NONI108955_40850 [Nocardia ninae]
MERRTRLLRDARLPAAENHQWLTGFGDRSPCGVQHFRRHAGTRFADHFDVGKTGIPPSVIDPVGLVGIGRRRSVGEFVARTSGAVVLPAVDRPTDPVATGRRVRLRLEHPDPIRVADRVIRATLGPAEDDGAGAAHFLRCPGRVAVVVQTGADIADDDVAADVEHFVGVRADAVFVAARVRIDDQRRGPVAQFEQSLADSVMIGRPQLAAGQCLQLPGRHSVWADRALRQPDLVAVPVAEVDQGVLAAPATTIVRLAGLVVGRTRMRATAVVGRSRLRRSVIGLDLTDGVHPDRSAIARVQAELADLYLAVDIDMDLVVLDLQRSVVVRLQQLLTRFQQISARRRIEVDASGAQRFRGLRQDRLEIGVHRQRTPQVFRRPLLRPPVHGICPTEPGTDTLGLDDHQFRWTTVRIRHQHSEIDQIGAVLGAREIGEIHRVGMQSPVQTPCPRAEFAEVLGDLDHPRAEIVVVLGGGLQITQQGEFGDLLRGAQLGVVPDLILQITDHVVELAGLQFRDLGEPVLRELGYEPLDEIVGDPVPLGLQVQSLLGQVVQLILQQRVGQGHRLCRVVRARRTLIRQEGELVGAEVVLDELTGAVVVQAETSVAPRVVRVGRMVPLGIRAAVELLTRRLLTDPYRIDGVVPARHQFVAHMARHRIDRGAVTVEKDGKRATDVPGRRPALVPGQRGVADHDLAVLVHHQIRVRADPVPVRRAAVDVDHECRRALAQTHQTVRDGVGATEFAQRTACGRDQFACGHAVDADRAGGQAEVLGAEASDQIDYRQEAALAAQIVVAAWARSLAGIGVTLGSWRSVRARCVTTRMPCGRGTPVRADQQRDQCGVVGTAAAVTVGVVWAGGRILVTARRRTLVAGSGIALGEQARVAAGSRRFTTSRPIWLWRSIFRTLDPVFRARGIVIRTRRDIVRTRSSVIRTRGTGLLPWRTSFRTRGTGLMPWHTGLRTHGGGSVRRLGTDLGVLSRRTCRSLRCPWRLGPARFRTDAG